MPRLLLTIALLWSPHLADAQERVGDAPGADAAIDAGDAAADAGDGGDAGDAADAEEALAPALVQIPDEPFAVTVGVAGSAPFVVEADGDLSGISVEIWEELAKRHTTYEYRTYPNVLTLVNGVARGEVDVGIGPISITADRAARVAFTQPHYFDELVIAARPSEQGFLRRIARVFNETIVTFLGGFLLLLVVVGTLLWLAERKKNPEHFPPSPLPGIANGAWLALVTLTTVGYGDRVPITTKGRVIVGMWMLAALVGTSSLTAVLATTLTLSELEEASVDSVEDLRGRRVAVPRGTAAVPFVRRHHGRVVLVDSVEEALGQAADGTVAATVFDRAVLSYHLSQNPDLGLVLSAHSYEPVGYGFCVAMGSELEEVIDIQLLELRESPRMDLIRGNWLAE